ncbi:hypothetical protein GZ77_08900 [Endozoicomonas montiporae]|uniref:Uncharacterized protein n=2 Tax=Endozoicomonas montiporae TaxID=1027273 RepID=A0A081N7P6_9GAMM|nr:inositol phosphate phosphatase SopB [Endozoicomonas montiporae]AMO55678.1 IpgD [Endozoicomonas montiporae CL-33]KEQ14469.1 hypothetical protein GZ77_08900 [Endozoicomonas montiporae]
MDNLQRLLSPAVSGVPDQTEIQPAPSGVWLGRDVRPLPLGRELGLREGEVIATERVTGLIEERYGPYVKREIDQYLGGIKTLDERDVVVVDKQARKIFRSIREDNREMVKSQVDARQVGTIFEHLQIDFEGAQPDEPGVSWNYLPEHEQQFMLESVQTRMLSSQSMLTFNEIPGEVAEHIESHQTLFSASAPRVSDFLEDHMELRTPVKPGDLRRLGEGLYYDFESPQVSRRGLGLMRNVDIFTNRTARMLYNSPLEIMSEKPLGIQILEARAHARDLMRGLSAVSKYGEHLPSALEDAMIKDLRSQFYATLDHIHQLGVMEANNPLSHSHWQKCKQDELVAALDVLFTEERKLGKKFGADTGEIKGSKARFYNRIHDLTDEFADLAEKVEGDEDGDLLPSGMRSGRLGLETLGNHPVQDAERYARLIIRRLKSIGIKKAEKKLSEARTRRMANVQWETVETRLEPRINNRTLNLKSRIIPAAKFQVHMGRPGNVDIFPAHLHGKGKPSSKRDEADNAVNLGETQLLVEQGGKSKSLFRGLRSGTFMAFGISNKKKREQANDARCYDLAIASLKQVLDDDPGVLNHQPVPVKLSTLQLLTPDRGRHYSHIHDDELKMQREQMEALHRLKDRLDDGEPLVFADSSGRLHEVDVEFDFAATNFGVNNLALEKKWRFTGPWGAVRDANREGLEKLMGGVEPGDEVGGWAQDFLNGPASEKDKEIVMQLIEQIRDLYESEDYKNEGEDAYKMVARVLLLSYKLGLITHFNCKSGKDRTGEADAAAKRLAAEVEALGYVPDPRQVASQEERTLSQLFALETGNVRWQQMNINRPGYKTTTGIKRLGKKLFRMIHV